MPVAFGPYPPVFPKAVLFDWDNTLVDTWRVLFNGLNHVFSSFGRPLLTREEYFGLPPLSARDLLKRYFAEPEICRQAELAYRDFLMASEGEHVFPMAQGAILLEFLKERGTPMGVVSNKDGDVLRQEVASLGWTPYFRKIVGSRDTLEDKPSPLPIIEGLGKACLPGESWFVGDSVVDMEGARRAGLVPVCVGEVTGLDYFVLQCGHLGGVLRLLDSLYNPN